MVQEGQSTPLRVDQDGLRGFADALRAGSGRIGTLNAGDLLAVANGALPGTGFGDVVGQATDAVNRSLARVGERLNRIADSTQNAAKVYEVAESDFTGKLETIGLSLP